MATVLITGCSRGLGLELAKKYTAESSTTSLIFATARSESPSAALAQVITDAPPGRIQYVQLDIDDPDSISRAASIVDKSLPTNSGLDILINNAAIIFPEYNGASGMPPSSLSQCLATNVTGVHAVTLAFLPLLRRGSTRKTVNITSTLGSIGMIDPSQPAVLCAYRISKTALNMLTAQWAQELGKPDAGAFTVFCVSPGWLKTDLGGGNADLDAHVGAALTWEIVRDATREKDGGKFRNISVEGYDLYNGANPPW